MISISTSGYISEESKNINSKRYIHFSIYNSTIILAKIWKQPNPSIDEWIKKIWYIYTMGYYSAIKKNENLLWATIWMDLEDIMLSEISQSKTNTVIIYMGNL